MILKKLNILFFVLLGFFSLSGQAQTVQNNTNLYLFTDRDYCISGDTLWFKIELKNGKDEKSNVVHVQLDSPENNLISTVINRSKSGWAEGYMHIPDSLSTGVYFLTSFLNSQRNIPDFKVETRTLFVYNRFEEQVLEIPVPLNNLKVYDKDFSQKINISLDKTNYKPREKVSVNLGFNGFYSDEFSNVIVKATRLDNLAVETGGKFLVESETSNQTIPFLNEKDGFVLSGKVTEKESGLPKLGIIILLSITGEPPYFDYCVSGEEGDFHFFLKDAEGIANVVLQAVSENDLEFDIQTEKNDLVRKQEIRVQPKTLTQNQTEFISSSISGNFFNKLFNTNYILQSENFNMPVRFTIPFYGEPKSRVIPDEFIDLPDFQEISRELLSGVQYRARGGEIEFRLLNELQSTFFEYEPLRLINGIPVFKNNLFASLNSTKIDYIDFILQERLFGDLIFKGVLAVSLNDKSNGWLTNQPNIYQFNVACLQSDKTPGYLEKREFKMNEPDIRQVYFWEIMENDSTLEFEFNLSDLKGKVEISVEGVTKNNESFKAAKIIEVK